MPIIISIHSLVHLHRGPVHSTASYYNLLYIFIAVRLVIYKLQYYCYHYHNHKSIYNKVTVPIWFLLRVIKNRQLLVNPTLQIDVIFNSYLFIYFAFQ